MNTHSSLFIKFTKQFFIPFLLIYLIKISKSYVTKITISSYFDIHIIFVI